MSKVSGSSAVSGVVVTIGELVVDWISLEKGRDWSESQTFLRSPGGNAANVAQALAKLGSRSRLVAKIGRDIHAGYLLDALKQTGVDIDHVYITDQYATAQCYVLTDAREENSFFNWPQPNACHKLTINDLGDIFDDAQVIHTTGISLTVEPRSLAIVEVIRMACERGLIVSFDAGFPTGEGEIARTRAMEAMAMAHILKVNLPELYYWLDLRAEDEPLKLDQAGLKRVEEYGKQLRRKTACEILLLTLGVQGSIIISDKESFYTPAVKVEALDGVGAGDAYCAAILHQLVKVLPLKSAAVAQGKLAGAIDWREAARFANVVGALATRTVSASQGLPTIAEVESFYSRHY